MRTSMVQNNGTQQSQIHFKAITASEKFLNTSFVKGDCIDQVKATRRIIGDLSSDEILGLEHLYQKGSEIIEAVKKIIDPERVNIHLDQTGTSTFITGHKGVKGFFKRGEKIESNMMELAPNGTTHDLIHVTPETLSAKITKVSGLDVNA